MGSFFKWHFLEGFSELILCVFLLTFWIPFSFYLGGDAFFFGRNIPYQVFTFPFPVIVLLLLLFLNFKRKDVFEIQKEDILVLLAILSFELFIALFSKNPNLSALGTLGYMGLFFTIPLRKIFSKLSPQAFFCLGFSLVMGSLFAIFYKEFSHPFIIGIGSIWFLLEAFNRPEKKTVFPFLIILWTLNAVLGNTLALFCFFILWMGINLWAPKGSYRPHIAEWNTGIFFLLTLIFTLFLKGGVQWALPNEQTFVLWKQIPNSWIFGVGERQFFQIFAQKDFISLRPELWKLPHSDLLITLFEKGILGLFIPLGILFYSLKRNLFQKKTRILLALFLLSFSQGLWTSPLGLVFLGLLLFS